MKNITYFFAIFFYAFSTVLAAEPVVWNGSIDVKWYNDNETEFTITTAEELAGLAKLVNDDNNFKDKIVTLGADIILNDTTNWQLWDETSSNLNIWISIGGKIIWLSENVYMITKFTGTFEGNGYKISGLYINTANDYQGLFGSAGTIKDISVLASWIKGGNYVGSIAGVGRAYSSYAIGKVSGQDRVGGILGNGSADYCHFTGLVNGNNYVGGISGSGGIISGYSMGTISGIGSNIGGLVGYTENTIRDSYSDAIVKGGDNVGGIAGHNNLGRILNSYYIKEATGNNRIGGIAGRNDGTISNCYSTGIITGNNNIGGITGANYYSGSVYNSYSMGDITGINSVGGISGISGFQNEGVLENNYSKGTITGDKNVGGLVGILYDGFIINNYSIGIVNGKSKVGGTAGTINGGGTIANNYSSGKISGIDSIGGVTGNNYRGKVFSSYWNATLNAGISGVECGVISEESVANLVGITDTEMKKNSFVGILNDFVDSVAQTGKSYHSWLLDANNINKGYPMFRLKFADATVTIAINSYTYSGNEYTPVVTVKSGEVTLTEGTDYTVSYTNNTNSGNATINITGINSYSGTKTTAFNIAKKVPTVDDLDFTQDFGTVVVKSPMAGMGIITIKYNGSTAIPTTVGTYTVTADIEEGTNFKAATEILLGSYTIKEETSAIQRPILASNIKVLINAGNIQVQGINKAERLQLLNLKGSILLNKIVQPNENISIAHLPKGVYLVNVGGKFSGYAYFFYIP
jgi:carbon monoxide dehydrogenase subunit G